MALEKSNPRFISEVGPCELCGAGDCAGGALSIVKLLYGYGSRHDGESIELAVCGSCIDRLNGELIQDKKGGGAA